MKKAIIRDYSFLLLPNLDSNQDKQSQSLSYYRYTIRQGSFCIPLALCVWDGKITYLCITSKKKLKYFINN